MQREGRAGGPHKPSFGLCGAVSSDGKLPAADFFIPPWLGGETVRSKLFTAHHARGTALSPSWSEITVSCQSGTQPA
jgi:hypothetical protein